jgi:uncharacterized protein (TIGR00106 family)
MSLENQKIIAQISVIPLGKNYTNDMSSSQTSMSKEIAVAFDAIKKIPQIKVTLTAMGTDVEANNLKDILKSIELAHEALKEIGIKRIISTIRIDERLDKLETMEDRVNSVKEKLDHSNESKMK